jgi:hypothetical protein
LVDWLGVYRSDDSLEQHLLSAPQAPREEGLRAGLTEPLEGFS